MKFELVIILSFAILAYICTSSNAQSHNVRWGARTNGDVLIHREVAFQKSSLFFKTTGDFRFDQKNVIGFPKLITFVNVTDQYTNNNGGTATLTSGGPNYQHVEIHFTSKRSRGYNFIIEVFGLEKINNVPTYQHVAYGKK